MKGSSFHKEIAKAPDAVKFPIEAFNVFIQDIIEKHRRRYHLVIINNYVSVKYNGEYLFIYVKDESNVKHRINIEL